MSENVKQIWYGLSAGIAEMFVTWCRIPGFLGGIMLSISYLFEYKKHDHWYSKNIKLGSRVYIVLKKDQKSGIRTEGYVDQLLTKKARHSRGIKVRLTDGQVGRVQNIL